VKLLFDENLSHRTVLQLRRVFPGAVHVSSVGLGGEDDELVWRHAKLHGMVIVSADSDFVARALTRGHPPKVVYVVALNATWRQVSSTLLNAKARIAAFLEDDEAALLILPIGDARS
jgi:predicted nuclease of predicted toxin-antitoxin system